MLPSVNILIPVFNQNPAYLGQCISSALNQTYSNLCIIVSDNHSTLNETKSVIHDLCESSLRVRLISPPSHLSIGAHFQFVLDQATADWLTFLSSDDFLHPEFVEISVQSILSVQPTPGFSYCRTRFVRDNDDRVVSRVRHRRHGFSSQPRTLRRFLTGKEGSFCGLLVNTLALRQFEPFPSGLAYSGDLYIGIQLAKRYSSFFIDQSLATLRLHHRYEQDARLPFCIADIVRIYADAINDPEILRIVGLRYVKKCFSILLQYWIYSYAIHASNKSLPAEVLDSAKDLLLSVDSSRITRLLLQSRNRFGISILLRIRFLLAMLKPQCCPQLSNADS